MNKYLSDKLRAISFISMVMVVFLHSYNLKIKFKSETQIIEQGFTSLFQDLISQGFARIAVPFFFIISGFLFFLSIDKGTFSEFLQKYKKRSKTLFLPYLLWSLYGLLLYFVLQSLPFSNLFFTKELIINYSFGQLLSAIVLNPIPYQLWFIRDLMVLILISPVLYWLIKYLGHYVIFIFLIIWMYDLDFIIFSNESLCFFAIGGLYSIKNIEIPKSKLNYKYLVFSVAWVLLISIKTALSYVGVEDQLLVGLLHKISILIGIPSIWLLYDRIFWNIDLSHTKIYELFQYTFFLYVFHEPILTIFEKALYYILGQSQVSSLLIYILAPVITIFTSIAVGSCVKKFRPSQYFIITGGR